jgi:hypothetical protein
MKHLILSSTWTLGGLLQLNFRVEMLNCSSHAVIGGEELSLLTSDASKPALGPSWYRKYLLHSQMADA